MRSHTIWDIKSREKERTRKKEERDGSVRDKRERDGKRELGSFKKKNDT
jgi:hypothetical protein